MRLALLALATLAYAAPGLAEAQTAGCPGQWGVVRVSTIKPGQMALFRKAVSDQKAWYRAHGFNNNVLKIGQVQSPTGFDESEVVTLHLDTPPSQPTRDAPWDAFVKEFRDSSDVTLEKRVCLTDPA